MSDEAAFLAALKANPADDTMRLVYADWLDEHGEAAKAEYLRLVAALVRAGGDLTDRPEGDVLQALAPQVPEDWRKAAGARFVATLFSYGHQQKVNAIKHIREAVGCGLGEAKAMSERLPDRLLDRVTFDRAREVVRHMRNVPDSVAAVLPTELENLPFVLRYEVVAACNVWAPARNRDRALRAARDALTKFLVRARRLSAVDAGTRAESHLVVLERDLSAGEAADRSRELSQYLIASDSAAQWSVGVYTRQVAVENEHP